MRTAKTLFRPGGCPGWSESSLGTHSFCWFCPEVAHFCLNHYRWSCIWRKNVLILSVIHNNSDQQAGKSPCCKSLSFYGIRVFVACLTIVPWDLNHISWWLWMYGIRQVLPNTFLMSKIALTHLKAVLELLDRCLKAVLGKTNRESIQSVVLKLQKYF